MPRSCTKSDVVKTYNPRYCELHRESSCFSTPVIVESCKNYLAELKKKSGTKNCPGNITLEFDTSKYTTAAMEDIVSTLNYEVTHKLKATVSSSKWLKLKQKIQPCLSSMLGRLYSNEKKLQKKGKSEENKNLNYDDYKIYYVGCTGVNIKETEMINNRADPLILMHPKRKVKVPVKLAAKRAIKLPLIISETVMKDINFPSGFISSSEFEILYRDKIKREKRLKRVIKKEILKEYVKQVLASKYTHDDHTEKRMDKAPLSTDFKYRSHLDDRNYIYSTQTYNDFYPNEVPEKSEKFWDNLFDAINKKYERERTENNQTSENQINEIYLNSHYSRSKPFHDVPNFLPGKKSNIGRKNRERPVSNDSCTQLSYNADTSACGRPTCHMPCCDCLSPSPQRVQKLHPYLFIPKPSLLTGSGMPVHRVATKNQNVDKSKLKQSIECPLCAKCPFCSHLINDTLPDVPQPGLPSSVQSVNDQAQPRRNLFGRLKKSSPSKPKQKVIVAKSKKQKHESSEPGKQNPILSKSDEQLPRSKPHINKPKSDNKETSSSETSEHSRMSDSCCRYRPPNLCDTQQQPPDPLPQQTSASPSKESSSSNSQQFTKQKPDAVTEKKFPKASPKTLSDGDFAGSNKKKQPGPKSIQKSKILTPEQQNGTTSINPSGNKKTSVPPAPNKETGTANVKERENCLKRTDEKPNIPPKGCSNMPSLSSESSSSAKNQSEPVTKLSNKFNVRCQQPHDAVTKAVQEQYQSKIICIHNPPCVLINGCLNLPNLSASSNIFKSKIVQEQYAASQYSDRLFKGAYQQYTPLEESNILSKTDQEIQYQCDSDMCVVAANQCSPLTCDVILSCSLEQLMAQKSPDLEIMNCNIEKHESCYCRRNLNNKGLHKSSSNKSIRIQDSLFESPLSCHCVNSPIRRKLGSVKTNKKHESVSTDRLSEVEFSSTREVRLHAKDRPKCNMSTPAATDPNNPSENYCFHVPLCEKLPKCAVDMQKKPIKVRKEKLLSPVYSVDYLALNNNNNINYCISNCTQYSEHRFMHPVSLTSSPEYFVRSKRPASATEPLSFENKYSFLKLAVEKGIEQPSGSWSCGHDPHCPLIPKCVGSVLNQSQTSEQNTMPIFHHHKCRSMSPPPRLYSRKLKNYVSTGSQHPNSCRLA